MGRDEKEEVGDTPKPDMTRAEVGSSPPLKPCQVMSHKSEPELSFIS